MNGYTTPNACSIVPSFLGDRIVPQKRRSDQEDIQN
jgi:hypothetical protein